MLIFIPFLVLITIFLFIISRNNQSIKYLAILLLAFLVDTLSFMLYLGKDNYYYNIILNYFGISRELWNYFIFTPLSQDWIIRMINVSSVVFTYFNLVFAASFLPAKMQKWNKSLKWFAIPPVIQVLVYDPMLYKYAYLLLYPTYLSSNTINVFYVIFSKITFIVNTGYLLLSVAVLFYSYLNMRSVRLIKNYMFLIIASYLSIIITYCVLLLWAPTLLIKVSKIANYTSYLTVYLSSNVLIYHIFPYTLIFTLAVITFGMYRYAVYQQRVNMESKTISKEIDAASIASSVFSHYIKNELISIIAQIENIQMSYPEAGEINTSIQAVTNNCQRVLTHIDTIHKLVESSHICLQPLSFDIPIRNALSELSDSLKDIKVNLDIPLPCPFALIDSEYFSQVLINIITNDIEAMSGVPAERKMLDISVAEQSQWIVLSIKDYGTGIAPEHIKKIFMPYYSTKSSTKNWGIGLSLCHKIVTAHSGKIAVTSKIGEGTTFKILIPVMPGKKLAHGSTACNKPSRIFHKGFK